MRGVRPAPLYRRAVAWVRPGAGARVSPMSRPKGLHCATAPSASCRDVPVHGPRTSTRHELPHGTLEIARRVRTGGRRGDSRLTIAGGGAAAATRVVHDRGRG